MTFTTGSEERKMRRNRQDNQERLLATLVERTWDKVLHYRAKMEDLGLAPSDIRTLDDLHRLPFTTKNDPGDTYPDGLLACEKHEVVRYHASSGTTGKPTVVACTEGELVITTPRKEALPMIRYRTRDRATREVHNLLGIRSELHLLPPGSIERSEGKSKRIRSRS
jgi:phenylacetate-coenzyme A ligase PaaK-like adenylate-forming protein